MNDVYASYLFFHVLVRKDSNECAVDQQMGVELPSPTKVKTSMYFLKRQIGTAWLDLD